MSLIPCRKGASGDNLTLGSALTLQPLAHLSLTAHPACPGAAAQEGALLTLQAAPRAPSTHPLAYCGPSLLSSRQENFDFRSGGMFLMKGNDI